MIDMLGGQGREDAAGVRESELLELKEWAMMSLQRRQQAEDSRIQREVVGVQPLPWKLYGILLGEEHKISRKGHCPVLGGPW